ncbi:hypothetical protein KI387_012297 [Taxus chinensis]|uniref:Protein TIC 21, chloroplastic n=1 Tax=Taxus chinensis TaxID=29808 RepID=A0AA38FC83_TAXCH|nr:hypothetical protein KI387_012297 [Taxus chinensis]
MQVLSHSTLCLQMQVKVKGLSPPLHKPLPKPNCFARATKFSSGIISSQLPARPQYADVSVFSFFGASKNFSPLFLKDNEAFFKRSLNGGNAYNPATATVGSSDEGRENEKLAQVSKRLERTGMHFKRLGGLGFWSQLVCTVVSAVILAFSVVITGSPTSPPTFYMTAGGIVAAFLSVFWSFGYIRLSERLRKNANDPAKVNGLTDVLNYLVICDLF